MRKQREAAGLSRQRLSHLLAITCKTTLSSRSIANHEAGTTEPTLGAVAAYSYFFGIRMEKLINAISTANTDEYRRGGGLEEAPTAKDKP